MDRQTREAVRYLGYGKNAADERTLALIENAFAGLDTAAAPKSVCRIFDLEMRADGCIVIGKSGAEVWAGTERTAKRQCSLGRRSEK